MFYVLRTHGEIDKHWGFTAVATCVSKKAAEDKAKELLSKEPSKDKYVVVKGIKAFKYIQIDVKAWSVTEEDLC